MNIKGKNNKAILTVSEQYYNNIIIIWHNDIYIKIF